MRFTLMSRDCFDGDIHPAMILSGKSNVRGAFGVLNHLILPKCVEQLVQSFNVRGFPFELRDGLKARLKIRGLNRCEQEKSQKKHGANSFHASNIFRFSIITKGKSFPGDATLSKRS